MLTWRGSVHHFLPLSIDPLDPRPPSNSFFNTESRTISPPLDSYFFFTLYLFLLRVLAVQPAVTQSCSRNDELTNLYMK